MTRESFIQYVQDCYSAEPERPWEKFPELVVFRHADNRKWFALLMTVPAEKLGLQGGVELDIVNLKCDPLLLGSLLSSPGFFPAYHMNHENWVSVALDGSVAEEEIRIVLDMSYHLTARKRKSKKENC